MLNVLEGIPWNDERMGRREIVNEKALMLMQVALHPGQAMPDHKANADVHLLVMQGQLEVVLAGQAHQLKAGDIIPAAYQTPMQIKNNGSDNTMFLVLKTPNPSEFKLKST